ncbi:MAG: substrate-binding domain-containing protein [Lachnospiraceae bacterium]|nr:substrate-binding domain-containing protein [Lachnospiraceae bacterium]
MRAKTGLYISLTLLCAAAVLVVGFLFFRLGRMNAGEEEEERTYDRYYAVICDDPKTSFWQNIYQGASQAAEEKNACVELFGANLSSEYTTEQLMKIAISSGVDGIMVLGSGQKEMTDLIDKADAKGIPVVTMYTDNSESKRCSFVGVSSFSIGNEYGKQILSAKKEKLRLQYGEDAPRAAVEEETSVAVFFDESKLMYDQNAILAGIFDSLKREAPDESFSVRPFSVDDSSPFSVEECFRDVFMEADIPDILVCLSELDTTCAYQAMIDQNMVGSVYILGYYDSEKILNAISRNVVFSSLAVDTGELGRYGVEALDEYITSGNTSQFFSADVTIIDRNNVADFLKREDPAGE